MSKKKLVILLSAVAAIAAAVTAIVIFHSEIAQFIASVKAKLHRPAPEGEAEPAEPGPEFTPEEKAAFADI